jgi:hypothetical protein
MDAYTIDIFAKIIGVYSIFICIIGTLGNGIAASISVRKSLRQTPTFIFIGFALISDIMSLYFWNIDHYLLAFNSYQMEYLNQILCRFCTFCQTFSLQWSAWLLVITFFVSIY